MAVTRLAELTTFSSPFVLAAWVLFVILLLFAIELLVSRLLVTAFELALVCMSAERKATTY